MRLYPLATPGGSDTHVQYNDGNIFGGDSTFTFNDATKVVTANTLNLVTNTALLQVDGGIFLANDGTENLRFGDGTSNGDVADENTFIGYYAGYNNDDSTPIPEATGSRNVYIGRRAGEGATGGTPNSGAENVAIGAESLRYNTQGYENTACGDETLKSNTTGHGNCAFGNDSLELNTTGNFNSAYGTDTLYDNTTGGYNCAYGYQCLYNNTTTSYNTMMGYQCGYSQVNQAQHNIGFGYRALYGNTTGDYAISIGDESLYNDAGQYNVAVGYQALYNNDTTGGGSNGTGNIAFGYKAIYGAGGGATGYYNIGIGYESLVACSSSRNNVAIGYRTLYSQVAGGGGSGGNVAIGAFALYLNQNYWSVGIGNNAARGQTTGHSNVAIGAGALQTNQTGRWNVGLGYEAGYGIKGDFNYSIGYHAGNYIGTGTRNFCAGYNAGLGVNGNNFSDNVFIGNQSGEDTTTGGTCTYLGSYSGRLHTTGDGNLFLGYYSGYYQTTNSNLLIIDNQDRGNVATELDEALLYGTFNATVTSQKLKVNATLSTTNRALTLGVGATTFAVYSNVMTITGDGGGNVIATITGANSGTLLTLIFVDANVQITDDNTHAADSVDLSAAFTSADDTVLQLVYDGTSWYEVSRSVN